MKRTNKRPTPYDDWCVGENDTCARKVDMSKGEPGKDGLCAKHHTLKATPAKRK
jgi:hypothetical protein